jgi:hypothetical protein
MPIATIHLNVNNELNQMVFWLQKLTTKPRNKSGPDILLIPCSQKQGLKGSAECQDILLNQTWRAYLEK